MRRVLELCRLLALHLWIRHLDSKREIIWQNGCDYHSFSAFCSNAPYVITLIKRSWWKSSLKKSNLKCPNMIFGTDLRISPLELSWIVDPPCCTSHSPFPGDKTKNHFHVPLITQIIHSLQNQQQLSLSPGTSFKFFVVDIVRSLWKERLKWQSALTNYQSEPSVPPSDNPNDDEVPKVSKVPRIPVWLMIYCPWNNTRHTPHTEREFSATNSLISQQSKIAVLVLSSSIIGG